MVHPHDSCPTLHMSMLVPDSNPRGEAMYESCDQLLLSLISIYMNSVCVCVWIRERLSENNYKIESVLQKKQVKIKFYF